MLVHKPNSVPKDYFPIPLNDFDVQREIKTSLAALQDINDCWNMDGDNPLSEPWMRLTPFALVNESPAEGKTFVQSKQTKKQVTTAMKK